MLSGDIVTLPPELASAGEARRFVERLLDEPDAPWFHDAVLMVSELVTNTVIHAGTHVTIDVRAEPHRLRVEVIDGDPRLPSPQQPDSSTSTGRGLAIVRRQATRWGVAPVDGGKSVWFEIDH